jgi:hypothetical protein
MENAMIANLMSSQGWAISDAWVNRAKTWSRWLAICAVLLSGVALGVYAIPDGVVQGISSRPPNMAAALSRIEELEAELSDLEASTVDERMLRSTVEEHIGDAIADSDADVVVKSMSPALLYNIYNPEAEQCVSYLSFDNGGEIATVKLTRAHTCFSDAPPASGDRPTRRVPSIEA